MATNGISKLIKLENPDSDNSGASKSQKMVHFHLDNGNIRYDSESTRMMQDKRDREALSTLVTCKCKRTFCSAFRTNPSHLDYCETLPEEGMLAPKRKPDGTNLVLEMALPGPQLVQKTVDQQQQRMQVLQTSHGKVRMPVASSSSSETGSQLEIDKPAFKELPTVKSRFLKGRKLKPGSQPLLPRSVFEPRAITSSASDNPNIVGNAAEVIIQHKRRINVLEKDLYMEKMRSLCLKRALENQRTKKKD